MVMMGMDGVCSATGKHDKSVVSCGPAGWLAGWLVVVPVEWLCGCLNYRTLPRLEFATPPSQSQQLEVHCTGQTRVKR